MSIEKLKEINDKLTKLLDDPQPGLFTWNSFVKLRIKQLYDEMAKTLLLHARAGMDRLEDAACADKPMWNTFRDGPKSGKD